MSLSRVYPAGWSVGEKLTSAQANALDVLVTGALDKRNGQSDTLQSVVAATGAGRVVDSYAVGPDADATLQLSVANRVYVATLTADRTYTLSATGAVLGDEIKVRNSSAFKIVVKDQAAATLATLGPDASADSTWASFVYTATGWVVFWLSSTAKPTAQLFTANGSWTCPAGVNEVLCIGWGGGGGGGGGGNGSGSATNVFSTGGGGGGSAQRVTQRIAVAPGTVYAVTIGAGGGGGLAGAFGADGGTTSLSVGATTRFSAAGGQGGGLGVPAQQSLAATPSVWGGAPNASAPLAVKNSQASLPESVVQRTPGGGGGAAPFADGGVGSGSIDGLAGGNGGTKGTSAGSYQGGGGGGGGGGPIMDRTLISAAGLGNGMPAGASGGLGGNGASPGAGTAGSAGSSSSYANSGTGGGGGGGGGCGQGGGGLGGAGGNGIAGALYIIQIH